MRILYVSNGSNFQGAGGMEYHLLDVATQLRQKGAEVGFVIRKGTYLERELLAHMPHVYPLSCTGPMKLFAIFQLLKAVRSFKPDIISINRERDIVQTYLFVKAYNFLFKKQIKIVSVFHNLNWKVQFRLDRLDGLIFPNSLLKKEYAKDYSYESELSQIVYHGIDVDKFLYKDNFNINRPRKYLTTCKPPIIGMVGELRKNQIELVDVAVSLREKLSEFTIAIVGYGTKEQIDQLNEKIRSNNLQDHFTIIGNVNRGKIPEIFYDFDISLTTFRHEGFGIVFLESLASYTPLVAYNSGGPVEILAKGGGFLVDGGPSEMAEKVHHLVVDADARCKTGNDGRKVAQEYFSIESMGRKHFEYYEGLLRQ